MMTKKETKTGLSYHDAGVNIDAGNTLVEQIKGVVKASFRPEVMTGIGGFGAMFELPPGFREPVLVAGTDGVGTKLKLALDMEQHDSIGIDLVAMCANDLIVQGAEPLFFLDYYATGKLSVNTATQVVKGISKGCQQAGCSLIGGETAEMPGMYHHEDYDLAGFCVGIVEKSKIIDGQLVQPGDVLLGLASSGVHSNGYSLVRKIIEISNASLQDPIDDSNLGKILLTPTRIYVKPVLSLIKQSPVHALSHITGGGLLENIPRVLPDYTKAVVDVDSYPMPGIFQWLQTKGNIDQNEMFRTFNCGIGMIIIVPAETKETAQKLLEAEGEEVYEIGRIRAHKNKSPGTEIEGSAFQ